MKFPSIIGPHSIYYLFMVLAVVLFFSGIELLLNIIREHTFKDNIDLSNGEKKNWARIVLIELIIYLFGVVLIGIVSYLAFYPLLNTTLFGDLTWLIVILLIGVYTYSSLLKIFCSEKGVFGVPIFVPLALFTVVAFLFHI